MNGHSDVIDMEENGEIELIETSPNYHMGWVNSDNTSTTITGHEYVPTNWQEIQSKDLKEMENENE